MPFLFHAFHIEMRVRSCWPWKSLRIIFFLWGSSNEEFMSEVMRQYQAGLNQSVLVFCSVPWFCWCQSQNTRLHPWIFAILIYKIFSVGYLDKVSSKTKSKQCQREDCKFKFMFHYVFLKIENVMPPWICMIQAFVLISIN